MADEKYRLQLEGDQIDDALMQMFLRAPEGWTQGTRDGVAVGSGSQYFHNNAKWFAEQAATSAARAEGAIPSGTAGAVFFDRAQSLTPAQQAQARKNIMAGGSNPNLLDNGWFRINQRSLTSGTANQYCADRWLTTYGSGGVTWSRTDDTITIQSTSGTSHGDIRQNLEPALCSFLAEQAVTISVKLNDNSIISKPITFPAAGEYTNQLLGKGLDNNDIYVQIRNNSNNLYDFQIWKWKTPETYKAVKLELGTVPTLANDTPPKGELEACQESVFKYVVRMSAMATGFGVSSTYIDVFISTPVTMRQSGGSPRVAATDIGNMRLIKADGSQSLTPSAVTFQNRATNGVVIRFTVSSAQTNVLYYLTATSGTTPSLLISIDL